MRILFLSAASSIHTVRWVNALVNRNHEIILVSLPDHHESVNEIDARIQVIYLPLSGTKGYYLNARALKEIYTRCQPDIVHVHYASGYGTLARIAKIPNIILSVWGSDVYDFPYQSKLKMHIVKSNLNYASYIASTSHVMAEQTKRLMKKERAIAVTPFGVDVERFASVKKTAHDGKFVFGTIKTLSEKYGIDTIIKAFSVFYETQISANSMEKRTAELHIYGQGDLLGELQKLTERLSISDKVFFHGYISNKMVPEALAGMDVFCLGSKCESFGVSAVEAMAAGLPVIATVADGFREVIDHEMTGFLVPIDDYKQMAAYMKILFNDEQLKRVMGKNSIKKVEELYRWDDNVKTLCEIYHYVQKCTCNKSNKDT